MKKLLMLLALCSCFALLCMLPQVSAAQKEKSLFPEEHKPVKRPAGITNCAVLNKFIADCFTLYDKTNNSRTALQSIYTQLNSPIDASGTNNLFSQFNTGYQEMISILPVAQNLITASPTLLTDVKKQVPVLQYIQAAAMFKSALSAARYSVGDLKYMITRTIPNMKSMFVSKKAAGADTMSIQQIQLTDSLSSSSK